MKIVASGSYWHCHVSKVPNLSNGYKVEESDMQL